VSASLKDPVAQKCAVPFVKINKSLPVVDASGISIEMACE